MCANIDEYLLSPTLPFGKERRQKPKKKIKLQGYTIIPMNASPKNVIKKRILEIQLGGVSIT
jgi:hypothetical protein